MSIVFPLDRRLERSEVSGFRFCTLISSLDRQWTGTEEYHLGRHHRGPDLHVRVESRTIEVLRRKGTVEVTVTK